MGPKYNHKSPYKRYPEGDQTVEVRDVMTEASDQSDKAVRLIL